MKPGVSGIVTSHMQFTAGKGIQNVTVDRMIMYGLAGPNDTTSGGAQNVALVFAMGIQHPDDWSGVDDGSKTWMKNITFKNSFIEVEPKGESFFYNQNMDWDSFEGDMGSREIWMDGLKFYDSDNCKSLAENG